MADINSFALMREATRIVEAKFGGALLVQMTANTAAEIPTNLRFWFNADLASVPNVRTALINYDNGIWARIVTDHEEIVGAVANDLFRSEIDLNGAVGYIRDSGYLGPLFFGGLLQPFTEFTPPNPLYNFTPKVGSGTYIFVDAVTGKVSWQGDSEANTGEATTSESSTNESSTNG